MKLYPRDVLVLLLYADGASGQPCEPVVGRTRLQKLLFLIGRESVVPRFTQGFYRFQPYRYGPFSRGVYDDLEFLQAAGVVKEEEMPSEEAAELEDAEDAAAADEISLVGERDGATVPRPSRYCLTDRGKRIAGELWAQAPSAVREAIGGMKAEFNQAPLWAVIAYVYDRYPDMAAESELPR